MLNNLHNIHESGIMKFRWRQCIVLHGHRACFFKLAFVQILRASLYAKAMPQNSHDFRDSGALVVVLAKPCEKLTALEAGPASSWWAWHTAVAVSLLLGV